MEYEEYIATIRRISRSDRIWYSVGGIAFSCFALLMLFQSWTKEELLFGIAGALFLTLGVFFLIHARRINRIGHYPKEISDDYILSNLDSLRSKDRIHIIEAKFPFIQLHINTGTRIIHEWYVISILVDTKEIHVNTHLNTIGIQPLQEPDAMEKWIVSKLYGS